MKAKKISVAAAALAAAAGAALLAGCPDTNPVDGLIKTPIEARGTAQVIVEGIEAEKALQTYVAQKGENPPSIEALEAVTGKLKRLPPGKAYKYDPETGKIWLEDVPR